LQDYTNYSRATYAGYYQCNYPGYPFVGFNPTPGTPGYCYSPHIFWTDHQTPRIRATNCGSAPPVTGACAAWWARSGISTGFTSRRTGITDEPELLPDRPAEHRSEHSDEPSRHLQHPSVRLPGDVFFDDITRGYEQTAAFTSIDFDIVPKVLTVTGGARWYDIRGFELGSNVGSFGCEIFGPFGGPNGSNTPTNPCVSTVATACRAT